MISILVRTFQSAKTLGMLFERIALAPGDEWLVVDSGSTDATLRIAEAHGARVLHAPPPFNYSKSLNLGFAAARNPWVWVLSSHSIPVVENLLEVWRAAVAALPEEVVVTYGVSTLSGKAEWAGEEALSVFSQADYETASRVCANCNALYRKAAWEAFPFDESKKTAEDKLWVEEALRRGFRFAYLPGARTVNKNQATLAYMFRKGYRDTRALPGHRPIPLQFCAGALKQLLWQKITGEIGWGNWVRYSAHVLGRFFGSRRSFDNTERDA